MATDSTMPAIQVSSRWPPVRVIGSSARPPSSTSLRTENQALRISCIGPASRPTSASSSTSVMALSAMPKTSSTVAAVLPSAFCSPGTARCATATYPRPPTVAALPATSRQVEISSHFRPIRRGRSAISMVPMPNMPMVPIRVIADTAADAWPTASVGAVRAASHQYANPNSEVMAVVAISEPALRNRSTWPLSFARMPVRARAGPRSPLCGIASVAVTRTPH
jgi:hypothetical protein